MKIAKNGWMPIEEHERLLRELQTTLTDLVRSAVGCRDPEVSRHAEQAAARHGIEVTYEP